MTALAPPPIGPPEPEPADPTGERFAAGATVLVGDLGDPVVFVAAAAPRIDATRLEGLQDLAGAAALLGVSSGHAEQLSLSPLRGGARTSALRVAPCLPVDAAAGLRGGWSLRDRARTIRTAAAAGAAPGDLTSPGHVTPVRIDAGATPAAAAALELSRWAGRTTAVVLAPVSDRDGAPVTLADAERVAALRRLPHASSRTLRARALTARARGRTVDCTLPTRAGTFRAVALDGDHDPGCLALVHGDVAAAADPLVHLHVACPPAETLHARTCDCAVRLHAALTEVQRADAGVLLYLRGADPLSLRCVRRSGPVDRAPALALAAAIGVPTQVLAAS